ncbi:MAG: hypothetical protein HKP27_01535, partial [Myxococcales bacterium]|nr:hypothetical protein [Myxococcales bacterium]
MIRPPAILQRFPRPILLLLASIVWAASASAQPFVDFEVIGDEGLKDVPALDGWMPPAGANVGPDNNYAQAMVVKDMGGGKQCVFVGTNRSWQANSAAQLGFLNGQGFVYPDFSIPGPSNDLRPLDDNAAWADANRSAIFRGCGYAGGAVTWDEVYRSPIVQSVVVAQQGSPPSVGIGDVPAFNSFRAGIEYKGWIVMGGGVGYAPGYTLVGSPTGEPGSWVHIETPNGVPSDTRALTKFKNRFCFGGGLDLTNPPLGNPGSNHIYCTKYLSANPNWTRVTPASGGPTAPGEGNVLLGAITEAGGKMFAGFANREGFQVWTFLPNFWNPYQGIWWKQVDKGAGEMANVLPGGFTKGLGDHVYMTTLNFPLGLADGSLFNCFFNPQNDPIQCLAGA